MAQYSSVKIWSVSDIARTAASKTIYVGKGMQDKLTNRPRLAEVLNHKQTSKTSARQTSKLFDSRLLPLQSAHLAFYVRPSIAKYVLACSPKLFTERYIFHHKFRGDFYKKCVESLGDDFAVKDPP